MGRYTTPTHEAVTASYWSRGYNQGTLALGPKGLLPFNTRAIYAIGAVGRASTWHVLYLTQTSIHSRTTEKRHPHTGWRQVRKGQEGSELAEDFPEAVRCRGQFALLY